MVPLKIITELCAPDPTSGLNLDAQKTPLGSFTKNTSDQAVHPEGLIRLHKRSWESLFDMRLHY